MIQKITIINGTPDPVFKNLNKFINETEVLLKSKGIILDSYQLRQKEIKQCTGCWDCWWKTPGTCRFNDDTTEILKSMITSNLVIYATPILMGMYSALLKTFHDRTIPLVHPYIKLVNNECHHLERYPNYPKLGILIDPNDATTEEIETTKNIFNRIKLNFHSDIQFFYSINTIQPKEVTDEISHI